jgi:hypothetical protein
MLKIFPSMLCTSRIHPFSLGNYSRTSLIIGNLMIIRVTSVKWIWIGYLNLKGGVMILDNASSHVVSSAKVGKSRGFSTLELSNMALVNIPSSQCYKRSSTFGSRYNSIFQNSIQEKTFAVGIVTI